MTPDFFPMYKIPRLYRDIVITEKLDGTNAVIWVGEDGEVRAGSKNRWLSPGKQTDNFAFAAWVEANADTLRVDLGPGWHRGEWWGLGINRGYGLYERRFSLFNPAKYVADPHEPWTGRRFNTPGLGCVPVLHDGRFSHAAVGMALTRLEQFGSEAAPGFMKPEGVIVYHKASGHQYKVTLENDGVPKGRVA